MADEPTNTTNKEDTPEWAKNLQETISDLPNRLKEILTPEPKDPPPVNQPLEIPLPQQPEPEPQPQPEPLTEPKQEEPEPKKKKSFLGWLL